MRIIPQTALLSTQQYFFEKYCRFATQKWVHIITGKENAIVQESVFVLKLANEYLQTKFALLL